MSVRRGEVVGTEALDRVQMRGERAVTKAKMLYAATLAERGETADDGECWTEFDLLDQALGELAEDRSVLDSGRGK